MNSISAFGFTFSLSLSLSSLYFAANNNQFKRFKVSSCSLVEKEKHTDVIQSFC